MQRDRIVFDAFELISSTLQVAQKRNKAISCTLVDASGEIICQCRHTMAGPHNLTASYRKAFTAMSQQKPTHILYQEMMKGLVPEFVLTPMPGGLCLATKEDPAHVCFGLGVGGAHGQLDVDIALEGMLLALPQLQVIHPINPDDLIV